VWSSVRREGGGDIMHTLSMERPGAEEHRDVTHIRFDALVDVHADLPDEPASFEPQAHYGQLQHIFELTLQAGSLRGVDATETLLLAGILPCKIIRKNVCGMPVYKEMGAYNVVDMTCVQCLVGRVYDCGQWTIIDWTGALQRAFYVPDEDN
ncbi:hypothetical protein FISHEDRAFT_35124, partial [Fistulina hepatica ATCC 64428]